MYEPFPGNYVWNLSVNICIGMGGAIGEIDKANERVRDLAKQGEDAGTEAFFASWIDMADGVVALADEAAAVGHFRADAEPALCAAQRSLPHDAANHGTRDRLRLAQLRASRNPVRR